MEVYTYQFGHQDSCLVLVCTLRPLGPETVVVLQVREGRGERGRRRGREEREERRERRERGETEREVSGSIVQVQWYILATH